MTFNMNSTSGSAIQQFRIDEKYIPEGEETNFTIKCSTCEGSSSVRDVSGSYSAPNEVTPQVCSTTLIGADERILTLSDDIRSLTEANSACSQLGGELATANEKTIKEILNPNLKENYLQDLLRVWIFEDDASFRYSLFPITGSRSETSWDYIDFYNREEKSTQQVTFCDAIDVSLDKWQVGLTSCGKEGWKEVFALFASNTSQPGYIPIYILTSDEDFSSKLSRENTIDAKFNIFDGAFYIPEFNLFVADEASKDCQVIRYGDDWETVSEACDATEAFYSCQIKFFPIIEPVECDSSKLIVSWSTMLSGIDNLNISVELSGDGFTSTVVDHDTLNTTIIGLTQRTTYSIEVTAHVGGCFEHALHSIVNETTSYGLADPVTNARIDQSTSVCTVIMPPDETGNLITYEILAESSQNTTYHEYELPTDGSDTVLQLNISMEFHGNNERIDFYIRATTCEGTNEWVKIEGFCTSPQASSPPPSSPLGVIVGCVCAVLAAAAFCIGGFVYYKRRNNFKHVEATISPTKPHPIDDMFAYGDIPLASTSLKALLFGMFLTSAENGFKDIQEEFESIKEESKKAGFPNEVSQKSENLPKNRYKNIFPMDHARVKLVGNLENDYINASYIAGYKNDCKFIAAQGPRPTTIGDFWMMIWEHNTPVVVMLTGLKENGKTKCEQYWPELGCSTTYGKLKINTLEENHFGAIVQRKFSVATIGEQRMITQYNYIGWPDHGTPITTTSLIHLRKMVEGSHDRRNPIVVHCSAGVGRTGTYIAMDVLFDRADNDEKVNFKKMVLKMRENRSEMVQTWKQYALVKRLVLEYISLPDSDKKIAKLQRMTNAQIKQLADQEFETLNAWRYGDQWIPGQPSLKTYESNLVKIWSETKQKIVEMNASYIEDLKFGGNFIATQCPVAGEEEEFWQMLSIRRASVLVCLDENASLHLGGSTQQYGDVTLGLSNFQKDGLLSTQDVAIASGRQEFFEVCLIKFNNWKNKPPAANELINLIGKMQEMKAKKQGEYVVICCKNGCDKTGTFIALVNILERLKSQNRVDVFRTIKDLRDMRPNMVDSLELYNYCYSVVLDYLSLFNAYDNFNFKSDEGNVKELANDPVYSNVSFK